MIDKLITQLDAQGRVEQVQAFKQELIELEDAGVLSLNQESAIAINAYHQTLLNTLAKSHEHQAILNEVFDSFFSLAEVSGDLDKALKMMNIAISKSVVENVENNAMKTRRINLLTLIKDKNAKSTKVMFKDKHLKSEE